MDPDEATMDVADAQGGGDNLLNPVTTATTAHPPTSHTDSAQDKNSTAPDYDPDSSKSPNNSSAGSDSVKEASLSHSSVQADPPDNGHLETEDTDQVGVDSGRREEFDTGAEEIDQEVPSSMTEDSKRLDDTEVEMFCSNDGGAIDEIDADGEGEVPKQKEEEGEERRNENEGQDEIPDSDETKKPSGQDDPTEDPINLKKRQRSNLFKDGLRLQENSENVDQALGCYLAAITDLTEMEAFFELPQCLHRISNIYFEKKEYEKAVHFVQAEKMYYETALIDIVNLQTQLAESNQEGKGDESGEEVQKRTPPEGPDSPEIIKAKEYENLAKLCLKESKAQLALEYCGKATKVYREVYGDDHPITIGSLDLFTMIYADVGKNLYADAMQKFDAEEKDLDGSAEQSQTERSDKVATAGEETTSELRHRSKKDAQVPSEPSAEPGTASRMEFEPAPQPDEHDDWVTTSLLMLLFFLITILVLLIMSYFYCLGNETSSVCQQFKGDLSYWYMKIKHYYLGFSKR